MRDYSRPHALIIDDSATERMWGEKLLLNMGCCVDMAHDGNEGLKFLLTHGEVDLVFLDLSMPRMDGKAFLEEIAKNEDFKKLKIIVISAKEESEVVPILQKGAYDYWLKGSGIPILKNKLKNLLYTVSLEKKLEQIEAVINRGVVY